MKLDTWTTAGGLTGTDVEYMVSGPKAQDNTDEGALKLRTLDKVYGVIVRIPEDVFSYPDPDMTALQAWVDDVVEIFLTSYESYPKEEGYIHAYQLLPDEV